MQTVVIVEPSTSYPDAVALCVSVGAGGYWLGVPPAWLELAQEQAWTLPCSLELDEQGDPTSWTPLSP